MIDPVLTTQTIALYPNRAQSARMEHFLFVGRVAFNRALSAHRFWYAKSGKGLNYYDHYADLTALRQADPFWRDVPVRITRDAVRRCHDAFQNFFRRVKAKIGPPGYPRFKGRSRWRSFSIGEPGTCVHENRIRVSGVDGLIHARNIRPVEGKIKLLRVLRKAGRWFCQLVIDDGKESPPPVAIKSAVGIDVGLTTFAALSNGEKIDSPRFGKSMAAKVRAAHKSVSRKAKGSNRRKRAVGKLQRVYAQLDNLRSNFVHHASKRIVTAHQFIAVEDLKIRNMARGRFAKSIYDACWGKFLWCLRYKAERAGCAFIKVNPAGTSQDCSKCGEKVQKDLGVRVHSCPHCGLKLDRDENAARNVLKRAVQGSAPASGRDVVRRGESVSPERCSSGGLVEASGFDQSELLPYKIVRVKGAKR